MKRPIVKQDENDEVPVEILTRTIAAGIRNLRKRPLAENALLLLIQDNFRTRRRYKTVKAHVSVTTIKTVLDSIEGLQTAYLPSSLSTKINLI
jgi:hypothetical protein